MSIRSEILSLNVLFCFILAGCGSNADNTASRAESNIPLQRGITGTLSRNSEAGLFFWDQLGPAKNPNNQKSVSLSVSDNLQILGWALNAKHDGLAGGVELTIDGNPYVLVYGLPRQDVADSYHQPTLKNCGWQASFPASEIGRGVHRLSIRVVAADHQSYTESPDVTLTIE